MPLGVGNRQMSPICHQLVILGVVVVQPIQKSIVKILHRIHLQKRNHRNLPACFGFLVRRIAVREELLWCCVCAVRHQKSVSNIGRFELLHNALGQIEMRRTCAVGCFEVIYRLWKLVRDVRFELITNLIILNMNAWPERRDDVLPFGAEFEHFLNRIAHYAANGTLPTGVAGADYVVFGICK